MNGCELLDSPEIELYFYGELAAVDRARVHAHLRVCEGCRVRLDDLQAIRHALAAPSVVDAPPAADWSGFMRRLDVAVNLGHGPAADVRVGGPTPRGGWPVRTAAALAATLAMVAFGSYIALRVRGAAPPPDSSAPSPASVVAPTSPASRERAVREATAEHLERSKLVVLGLAALDPAEARADDWRYERQLAGSLLSDTRLYRMAAQQRGMTDVAHVMRDLETVLIETSMSENDDRDALPRVQRLIARRDLVVRMRLASANGPGS